MKLTGRQTEREGLGDGIPDGWDRSLRHGNLDNGKYGLGLQEPSSVRLGRQGRQLAGLKWNNRWLTLRGHYTTKQPQNSANNPQNGSATITAVVTKIQETTVPTNATSFNNNHMQNGMTHVAIKKIVMAIEWTVKHTAISIR
jgi:hypothetical protein